MPKTVATLLHDDREDLLGKLLGAAYDARAMADRLHHSTEDPSLAKAVRRLDEAAAELERVTLRRPQLRLV